MTDYTIYVPEDIANLAIRNGFECKKYTGKKEPDGERISEISYFTDKGHTVLRYKNPTAEQLCGWLRDVHGIMAIVETGFNCDYLYKGISYRINSLNRGKMYQWHEYPDVILHAIKNGIGLIGTPNADIKNREYTGMPDELR